MSKDLLLVGSVPLDTVREVFEMFGPPLAPWLACMPDGEVGPRRHWISRVHYQVFAAHPELDIVARPRPGDNGVERQFPRDNLDRWEFRVKPGIEKVRFGDPGWRLGFARDALNSYFVFQTMKEKGVLPKGLKFQVSMPAANSVLAPRVFPTPGDIDRMRPGYEEALRAEIATMTAKIPRDELVIQFDCSTEVQDVNGAVPNFPAQGAIARNVTQIENVARAIPAGVATGIHLCYGTLGGWPRFQPKDLARTVELANAMISGAGRKLDYLHIPLLDTLEERFFAPLAALRPGATKIYLGDIHNMERFDARVALARKYLPDFGHAAFCGFGRMKVEDLQRVLGEHLEAMRREG